MTRAAGSTHATSSTTPVPAWRRVCSRCGTAVNFLARHGWMPLAAILLAGAAVWGFIELADDVFDAETQSFDDRLFLLIAGHYRGLSGFWQEVGRDLTALGGTTVITLIAVTVTLYLAFMKQWKSALFVIVAVVGGLVISLALKERYDRPRPDVFEHGSHIMTSSFPSGHSMNAAVAYLTMSILLAKLVETPRMKAYVFGVGLTIPVLVGFSRVALAVHWPTDVLAGWLVGLAWGLLVWSAATYLQARGAIEPEGLATVER